jgi:thiamine-phosphate pyrophosphorylase
VRAFQLRLKDIDKSEIESIAKQIKPICYKHQVTFIINDHADIAASVDADGVHLGKDDDSYNNARKILGANKVIGISCYNLADNAISAAESGADYVAFGALFPTTTKETAAQASPDVLTWWVTNATIPCVLIGGT